MRQEKEAKGIWIEEKNKLALFADAIMVYIEIPIESIKKTLITNSRFNDSIECKINVQSPIYFCLPAVNMWTPKVKL